MRDHTRSSSASLTVARNAITSHSASKRPCARGLIALSFPAVFLFPCLERERAQSRDQRVGELFAEGGVAQHQFLIGHDHERFSTRIAGMFVRRATSRFAHLRPSSARGTSRR